MSIDEIKEYVSEINPNAILIDGFDGGLMPYTHTDDNGVVHFVYSLDKCYEYSKESNCWTWEEFLDYWCYNVERSIPYLDENRPIIIQSIE